jgi:transposase
MIGRLPESWIPPAHLLDLRAQVRLRHTLSHQRGEWQQRIRSVLCHHGCPQHGELLRLAGRQWLAAQDLPAAARQQIDIALAVIDALEIHLAPMDQRLRTFARHQPGCRALLSQFGVGELTAVTILAELGDARRFSSSSDAVRFAGLDITVHQSDQRRAPGHLSCQGPLPRCDGRC